jgi:hypothetical protein
MGFAVLFLRKGCETAKLAAFLHIRWQGGAIEDLCSSCSSAHRFLQSHPPVPSEYLCHRDPDFSVDAFHFSTRQSGFVVAQYALSMAKQGSRHALKK